MKIKYLYINDYKNLSNLKMEFEGNYSVNALIGDNGSGKSNILEALTVIFSKVKSNLDVEFSFCVKYEIDENNYEISNMENGFKFTKNGNRVLKKDIKYSLPKAIFIYYTGETPRLKELSLSYVDKDFESAVKEDKGIVLKYLSYLTVEDFGAALFSNIVFKQPSATEIGKLLDVEEIYKPVTIKFKKPSWGKTGTTNSFWNATGSVATAIRSLVDISGGTPNFDDKNSAEIVIHDFEAFNKYWHDAFELFCTFKMLAQADILSSIEFNVSKKNKDPIYSYMNLSEGEKQLGQLLSLLDITKEYKALFLLDEFDAYLHPNWQREFVTLISKIDIRGQVIFTTHSPATLGKMKKNDVQFIRDGSALPLIIDTFNRDISEVMEEVMEVNKRPKEIEEIINRFRNAVVHNNKDDAAYILEEIKTLLTKDDPFLITAEIAMGRFED